MTGDNPPAEIEARHIICGRVALGWTQAELAVAARVGLSTVHDAERGRPQRPATNLALRLALERAGIVFLPDGIRWPAAGDGEPGPTTWS